MKTIALEPYAVKQIILTGIRVIQESEVITTIFSGYYRTIESRDILIIATGKKSDSHLFFGKIFVYLNSKKKGREPLSVPCRVIKKKSRLFFKFSAQSCKTYHPRAE